MPCYQLIVFAKPEVSAEKLTNVFRSLARLVYREQGQFRYIENYGVRPLAYPIRSTGQKYEEVRWIEAYYDCAPPALATIGALLAADKDVLQYKHLRNTTYLGEFKAHPRGERKKQFSNSVRYQKELLDPLSLELGPQIRLNTTSLTSSSTKGYHTMTTTSSSNSFIPIQTIAKDIITQSQYEISPTSCSSTSSFPKLQ